MLPAGFSGGPVEEEDSFDLVAAVRFEKTLDLLNEL